MILGAEVHKVNRAKAFRSQQPTKQAI